MSLIMIVDDAYTIRGPLRLALEELGHEVVDFENGKFAISHARENLVDLVITDLNMPIMSGMTLIASLRRLESYKTIPILVLTTESADGKKNKARGLGATGWLTKPFTKERIRKALEKTLE